MPRHGPLGDAPNPVQRAFVRWRWAAPAFFGLGISGLVVFLFAFLAARGEVPWLAVGIVGVVVFSVGTTVMFFAEGNHTSTREQRAMRWGWYMPWFERSSADHAHEGSGDPLLTTEARFETGNRDEPTPPAHER